MRLHVLGLGPIGCLLAHSLRRSLPTSHSITLIHKAFNDRRKLFQREQIDVEHNGVVEFSKADEFFHEVFQDPDFVIHPRMTGLQKGEKHASKQVAPIESLFVTLKAQHTVPALQSLSHRLNANSTVVLFQNGMGVYEALLSDVFRNPLQRPQIILASNTHGGFVLHDFYVIHSGIGSIEFGIVSDPAGQNYELSLQDANAPLEERRLKFSDISPKLEKDAERYRSLRETVAALLLLASMNASWRPLYEIHQIMRRKLVVNAAINPLTAILGCRNGDLYKHKPAHTILKLVCQEASEIFAAQMRHEIGHLVTEKRMPIRDLNNISSPQLPKLLESDSLEKEVLRVAELTRGNISSMLQDVRRGRGTEIDFINGYLETLGKEYNVATPVNSMLRNIVRLKYFMPLGLVL